MLRDAERVRVANHGPCFDRLAWQLSSAEAQAPTAELTDEWREHYAAYEALGLAALAELPQ